MLHHVFYFFHTFVFYFIGYVILIFFPLRLIVCVRVYLYLVYNEMVILLPLISNFGPINFIYTQIDDFQLIWVDANKSVIEMMWIRVY